MVSSWNRNPGVLKTQVTHRHREYGTRETTFILKWNSRNRTNITTAVAELKRLTEDRNLNIKEAEKFWVGPMDEGKAANLINWTSVADEMILRNQSQSLTMGKRCKHEHPQSTQHPSTDKID